MPLEKAERNIANAFNHLKRVVKTLSGRGRP
jgi:hypothetical protein